VLTREAHAQHQQIGILSLQHRSAVNRISVGFELAHRTQPLSGTRTVCANSLTKKELKQ
jgi:hypothetical protein